MTAWWWCSAGPGRRPCRRRHAADLDAALHDLGDGGDAFFQGPGDVVEHHDRDAAADVGPAMPAPMMPAPTTPTCSTGLRLDRGIGDAGVLLQPLRHEEHGDRGCARSGLPTSGTKALGLDLEALVERQVAALGDGVEGGQRGRELALGLGQHLGPGRRRT